MNASGWLQAIADTLTCACVVAQCIDCEGEEAVDNGNGVGGGTLLLSLLLSIHILLQTIRSSVHSQILGYSNWNTSTKSSIN